MRSRPRASLSRGGAGVAPAVRLAPLGAPRGPPPNHHTRGTPVTHRLPSPRPLPADLPFARTTVLLATAPDRSAQRIFASSPMRPSRTRSRSESVMREDHTESVMREKVVGAEEGNARVYHPCLSPSQPQPFNGWPTTQALLRRVVTSHCRRTWHCSDRVPRGTNFPAHPSKTNQKYPSGVKVKVTIATRSRCSPPRPRCYLVRA